MVFIPFMKSQSSASSTVYFTHSFPFLLYFLFLLYLCINPVLAYFWLWLIFKCGECSWSANYRKSHGGARAWSCCHNSSQDQGGHECLSLTPMSSAGNTLLPAGSSHPVALSLLLHVKQGLRPTLFASEDVTLTLKACDLQPLRVFLLVVLWTTFSSTAVETHTVSCFVGAIVCFSFFFFFFPQRRREEMSFSPCPSTCEVSHAPVSSKTLLLTGLEGLVLGARRWPSLFFLELSDGSSFRCSKSLWPGLHVLTTPDSLSPRWDCLMSHVFRFGKFFCHVLAVAHPSFSLELIVVRHFTLQLIT